MKNEGNIEIINEGYIDKNEVGCLSLVVGCVSVLVGRISLVVVVYHY